MLARLAALNAERRAEEAAGTVRWLRPAFQAPAAAGTQGGLGIGASVEKRASASAAPSPWPGDLAGQMEAVRAVLEGQGGASSVSDVARAFVRAKPSDVAEVLAALARFRLVHALADGRYAA